MRVHIHRNLDLVVFGQDYYFIVSLNVLLAIEEDCQLHLQPGGQTALSRGLDCKGIVGGLLDFDFLADLADVSDVDGDLVEFIELGIDEIDFWLGELKGMVVEGVDK